MLDERFLRASECDLEMLEKLMKGIFDRWDEGIGQNL